MMQGHGRPPVWPVFVAFLAAFGIIVAGSIGVVVVALVLVAATRPDGPGAAMPELLESVVELPAVVVGSLLVSVVTLLAIALIAPRLERTTIRERLRLHGSGRDVLYGVLAILMVMGLGQVMDSIAHLLGILRGSSLEMIAGAVQRASLPWFLALLVLGSIGPGVAEEAFFRGYAQTRLVQRWGRWTGILVASALFGLVHADLVHAPMAFVIGLVIGWVAERTGSIRPGIIAHTVNNTGSFLLLRLLPPQELAPETHGLLAVVGFAVAVPATVGLWVLTRRR